MSVDATRPESFVRRLNPRFDDPGVEAEFRAGLVADALPQLRFGLAFGIPIWIGVAAFIPLVVTIDGRVLWATAATMMLLDVLGLALTLGRPSLFRLQWVGVALNLANASAVIVLSIAAGETRFTTPGLVLTVIYASVVLRLRLVPGLVVSATVLVLFGVAIARLGNPGDYLVDVVLILGAVMVSAVAMYRSERSAREVFAQRRVIADQAREIAAEKEKSDRLLRSVLPESIADRLRDGPTTVADGFEEATILFSDLVGFTPLAATLTPASTARLLNELVSRFDELTADCGLEKVKTIGDAYMAVGGVPEPLVDHAGRAVELGLEMLEVVEEHARRTGLPLSLRIGIHTGPVVAGIIGTTRFTYDLWGDTVNIASRMESQGVPDCIQISEATAGLLGGRFLVEHRGTVEIKGRGPMPTYLVRGRSASAGAPASRAGQPAS